MATFTYILSKFWTKSIPNAESTGMNLDAPHGPIVDDAGNVLFIYLFFFTTNENLVYIF